MTYDRISDNGLPRRAPTTWEEIVGQSVPGWADLSDRSRRAIRSKGSIAGYLVDFETGVVTRKAEPQFSHAIAGGQETLDELAAIIAARKNTNP